MTVRVRFRDRDRISFTVRVRVRVGIRVRVTVNRFKVGAQSRRVLQQRSSDLLAVRVCVRGRVTIRATRKTPRISPYTFWMKPLHSHCPHPRAAHGRSAPSPRAGRTEHRCRPCGASAYVDGACVQECMGVSVCVWCVCVGVRVMGVAWVQECMGVSVWVGGWVGDA